MRRIQLLLAILLVFSFACRAVSPEAFVFPSPTSSPGETATARPTQTQASPTLTPRLPSPTVTPRPPEATLPPVRADSSYTVRLHPDGPLYVGDQVSLEIIPLEQVDTEGRQVQVEVVGEDNELVASLGPAEFGSFGIGGRTQATLWWAWDTSGLQPGDYTLSFSTQPGNHIWTETVALAPAGHVPPPEPEARWAQAESDCCLVSYITGTDVERDLPELLEMLDEQARSATQRLETDFSEAIPITLIPRVIGHGGFASDRISVSYLDRNYAGSEPAVVIHHEMIHLLDGRLGGEFRPTMLVEGLAVYLTGGHFKIEPLMPRAAALLAPVDVCVQARAFLSAQTREAAAITGPACGLDRYIPFDDLIDDFYFTQHEIGYLQAGALVEFMVAEWGWESFSEFYRDMQPHPSGSQAAAMEAALEEHFGLGLDELEARYLEALRQETLVPELVEDVRLTVWFYDTVRRYQQLLDPSAYFLTAWLPGSEQMRERGIVADYLRRPSLPENLAVEELLIAADRYLRSMDFDRTEQMLIAAEAMLSALEAQ